MVDLEEFPVALAESDAIEPMMQIPSELPVLPLARHRYLSVHDRSAVRFAGQVDQSGRRGAEQETG